MGLIQILYPLLAVGLLAGGGGLILHASRANARLVAARVDRFAPDAGAEAGMAHTSAFVRSAGPGPMARQIAAIERACRRLNIDPRSAPAIMVGIRLASGGLLAVAALVVVRFLAGHAAA